MRGRLVETISSTYYGRRILPLVVGRTILLHTAVLRILQMGFLVILTQLTYKYDIQVQYSVSAKLVHRIQSSCAVHSAIFSTLCINPDSLTVMRRISGVAMMPGRQEYCNSSHRILVIGAYRS